jgi:O-antigen ligase
VVLWALMLGCALGILPRHRPPAGTVVGIVLLALLAGWTAASTGWTDSAERTYAEIARVLGIAGLVTLVGTAVGPKTAIRASVALTVTAAVVCGLALWARLAPGALSSPLATADMGRRLSSPFGYWNALGCWAAMTAALCMAWSVQAPRSWLRGVCVAGASLAALVGYLTYSRAAVAGLVIGVVTVVALSAHRWTAAVHGVLAGAASAILVISVRGHPQVADGTGTSGARTVALVLAATTCGCVAVVVATSRTRLDDVRIARHAARALIGSAAVAVIIAAIAWGPDLAHSGWRSLRSPGKFDSGDPAARLTDLGGPRYQIWDVAIDAFSADPLRGIGAGTFEYRWSADRPTTVFVRDAHSVVIESLAELGLLGGFLVIGALAALLAGALTARSAARSPPAVAATSGGVAAFVVYCASASVDWMWESTAVTAASLCAVVIAASTESERRQRPHAPARTAGALVAVTAFVVQLPLLAASSEVQKSQAAAARGDLSDAANHATTAIQAEPWAASPLVQRAVVSETAGELGAARLDAVAATRREPTNWRPWILLARIEAERGRLGPAQRAVERARLLNPRSPLFAAAERPRRGRTAPESRRPSRRR